MVIDGLSIEEAVRLACQRHNELNSDELKFMQRLAGKTELSKTAAVRLTGIMRRLRQADLVAEYQRSSWPGI